MIRLIIYIFLGYLIYRVGKSWFRSLESGNYPDEDASSLKETELVQDPECGTYFLKQRGVSAHIGGQTLFFCSNACRDKYLGKH
jgi:YHS domain-containing protein